MSTLPTDRVRVLVLTADVGAGHTAAARAVAADLEGEEDADVSIVDGLDVFSPLLRWVMRDAYRHAVLRAPGLYHLAFRGLTGTRRLREAITRTFDRGAHRRMLELLDRERPDVVVSTHPALTAALGAARASGRLAVPVCATVTDLGCVELWTHPRVDLHLVNHPSQVPEVEALCGRGRAVLVQPMVDVAFAARRPDPAVVLGLLGLPPDARLLVVSGGGWGVGDLQGATDAALRTPGTSVAVLSGDDPKARAALERRYGDDPHVRVLGFTTLMPELLGAADALVHATGGMTSLEAGVRGCPLIAYGAEAGHIADHNAALERLGLAQVVRTREALVAALAGASREAAGWPVCPAAPTAGQAIVALAGQASTRSRTTRDRERAAALAPSTVSATATTALRPADAVHGSLATSGAASTGTTT
jgi:processive 1,2-diacylglycerol beta-glucosyltransferase